MLDIIIPVYNNPTGLQQSLFSLTGITCPFQVYVIDDCSNMQNQNISKNICDFFNQNFLFTVHFYALPNNSGPGIARQFGIDKSFNPYIFFLDCGDLIINPQYIEPSLQAFKDSDIQLVSFQLLCEEEPNNFYSWKHNSDDILCTKIVRRSFLSQYNIKFNPEYPYYFEDIGFINLIHIIGKYLMPDKNICFCTNIPLLVYTYEPTSLTKKDNHAVFFTNIISQAQNNIYAIEQSKNRGISEDKMQQEIYELLICIFMYYLRINEREPQYLSYINESLQLVYDKYFHNRKINPTLLYTLYTHILPGQGYELEKFPFIQLIEKLEQLEKNHIELTSS